MRLISLGVKELDRGLGGGIPHPSLISIEGDHGSGKTVFSQQIAYSMLKAGFNVIVITTESTVKEYLSMMKSIKLDATDYFISGRLKIYSLHVKGGVWSEKLAPLFLNIIGGFLELRKNYYGLVVIDDLSSLSLNTDKSAFLTFITRLKNIVSDGRSVTLTFHPKFFSDDLILNLKASSDVYLVMHNASIGGLDIKVLEIVKLWGSSGDRKRILNLEVNPNVGLRVIPIGEVNI